MKNHLTFDGWADKEVEDYLTSNGFKAWRRLQTGEVIGILPLLFTTSVCMDITPISAFAYRWCFADTPEAIEFFKSAVEYDEVPAPEKRTSLKGHRYGRKGPLLVEYDERGFAKW